MKQSIQEIATASKLSLTTMIRKIASKKFLVFGIATHMTYILLLDPQSWLVVAMLYLGLEGSLDWKNLIPGNGTHSGAATSVDSSIREDAHLP